MWLAAWVHAWLAAWVHAWLAAWVHAWFCALYTSDAADEEDSVALECGRIVTNESVHPSLSYQPLALLTI